MDVPACRSLSIVANPPDGGTVQAQTPPNCRGGYRDGTVVAVTASPAPGYVLASWTSSGGAVQDPDSPVTAVTVAGPTAVGANFERQLRPPTAHFVLSPASPRAGEAVQFTDTSSGFPTSWVWDIDGDGRVDTTARNPTFVFGAPGVYTTRLTAANHSGSSVTTAAVTIVASPEGLDAVDPNPELVNRDGTITQDPARWLRRRGSPSAPRRTERPGSSSATRPPRPDRSRSLSPEDPPPTTAAFWFRVRRNARPR